jgi:hypothetical protein
MIIVVRGLQLAISTDPKPAAAFNVQLYAHWQKRKNEKLLDVESFKLMVRRYRLEGE